MLCGYQIEIALGPISIRESLKPGLKARRQNKSKRHLFQKPFFAKLTPGLC